MKSTLCLLLASLMLVQGPASAAEGGRRRRDRREPDSAPTQPSPPTEPSVAPTTPSPTPTPSGGSDCDALKSGDSLDQTYSPREWNGGPILLDPRKAADLFKNKPEYCTEYRALLRSLSGRALAANSAELRRLSDQWAKRVWEAAYPNAVEAALVQWVMAGNKAPDDSKLVEYQRRIVHLVNKDADGDDSVGGLRAKAAVEAKRLMLLGVGHGRPENVDADPTGRFLKSKVGHGYQDQLISFYCVNALDDDEGDGPDGETDARPQLESIHQHAHFHGDGDQPLQFENRRHGDLTVAPVNAHPTISPESAVRNRCSTFRKERNLARPSGPNRALAGAAAPPTPGAESKDEKDKKKSAFWTDVGKDLVGAAFGAVAGGLIGFVFGGPIGAVVGAAIGAVAVAAVVHITNHPPGGGG